MGDLVFNVIGFCLGVMAVCFTAITVVATYQFFVELL